LRDSNIAGGVAGMHRAPDDTDFDPITELASLLRSVAQVKEVFGPPPVVAPDDLLLVAWEILRLELQFLRREQIKIRGGGSPAA
jgi:hypothetical protein